MNYYELLEITPNASTEVIKNSYKMLAKKFHPDTYDGDRDFAEEKMKLLNEAISVLENEEKRKIYNEENNIGNAYTSSFSTVFSPPDLSETFMDDIDNFLNKKNKKTSTPKSKKKLFSDDDSDDYDNIDNIDNISELTNNKNKQSKTIKNKDMSEYTQREDIGPLPLDDSIQESLRKFGYLDEDENKGEDEDEYDNITTRKKSHRRDKSPTGIWYWIIIAALVTGIIILGILIVQAFNLDNIRGLLSGNQSPDSENSGVNNIFDDWEHENIDNDNDFVTDLPNEELATEPAIEEYMPMPDDLLPVAAAEDEISQNVALPTQAPTPKPTNPPAPTQRATKPPAPTQKPTAAPTQPPTTQPVTEPADNNTDTTIVSEEEPVQNPEEVPDENIDSGEEQETTLENPVQENPDEQKTENTNTEENNASEEIEQIEQKEPENSAPPEPPVDESVLNPAVEEEMPEH